MAEIVDYKIGEELLTDASTGLYYTRLTLFCNGGHIIQIQGEHEPDCCECVGFDFDEMLGKDQLIGLEFTQISFKLPDNGGLLIVFDLPGPDAELDELFGEAEPAQLKLFVNSYNYQNGYYSSNLDCRVLIDGVQVFYSPSVAISDEQIY